MKRIFLLLIALPLAAIAQKTDWVTQVKNKPFVDVRTYGAVGDGNHDDTSAIQAAITAAGTNGPVGTAGRHMGVVLLPPGTYLVTSPVTIPAGTQVEIRGAGEESVWGTVIKQGSAFTSGCIFQVTADSTTIDNLAFIGINNGVGAICLGTSTSETFDSHIYWNWFQGMFYGLRCVNYSGGQFTANTFELGTFGIYSDVGAGDKNLDSALITNNRMFQNGGAGIYVHGDGTAHFWNNSISDNLFDYNTNSALLPNAAQVDLSGLINTRITANSFASNLAGINTTGIDDIKLFSSYGGLIADNTHYNTGRNPVNLNGDIGLVLSGDSSRNCNVNGNAGTTAAVLSDNMTAFLASGIVTTAETSKNLCAYSVYVGSSSSGTRLGQNNVIVQATGTYEILDTTAGAVDGATFRSTGPGKPLDASSLALFSSGIGTATAENLYGIGIDKSGVDTLLLGINKNTPTGSVPGNAAFLSTNNANLLCLGRGNGAGLPNTCDIQISGAGAISTNGGSASTVVCWKADGKTLGYATVAEITAGTCH